MKICIITVNYGNTIPTQKLINSIEKCDQSNNAKVIIADNEMLFQYSKISKK